MNNKDAQLDILAHLDVVPAGDGWTVTKPFEPVVKDGKIYGRGTADDKGPAVAALYAMRAVNELGIPLKKNVRLILGTDEECGSSDITHYYSVEKEAPMTFSPDASFPVINIEKGRIEGNFTAEFEPSDKLPKMVSFKIDPDKIREVIGSGGKVIQKIVADTGAKIDINDDGTVCVAAVDKNAIDAAKAIIDAIVFEPVVGETYDGVVTRIVKSKDDETKDVGVIVEYAPGKDTLVHISKLQDKRTEHCEDVCRVGDHVRIKYMGIDKKGRQDFSMKDAD